MSVAWPTDPETSTTEKTDCYTHVFQGRGRARLYKATRESVESGSRGTGKKTEAETSVIVSMKQNG